ncbi:hypothetical protein PoB_003490300 [Plakobranchus ocellatus]|uniref:Uncharacterized protein n=1 Tax=Plakobranchus ocellatus TaxID=259542 RepID=A0AAV4APB7_9GAST|nr:hypothetical protein PoB_003490300 [Plakobranchus ocellatus]
MWVSENVFRFSVSNTTCVHFHRQRIYTEPALHLDGQPIPVKGEAKFLGVVFDSKLTFYNHVQYLKKKCLKALNLLRVVGHTDWGADRATLLKLYRTLVRSKLHYGSIVYGSAKKHVLGAVDLIHHQGLRIALGAFRTSPIKSLYAEAGKPSLEHRRINFACNYVLKLKSLPRNPCHEVVFEDLFSDFSADTKSEPNLVASTFEHIKNAKINLNTIDNLHVHCPPPWEEHNINVDFSPTKQNKENTSIQGNENVDKLAKAALNRASCSGKFICYSDLKPKINTNINSVWQKNLDAKEPVENGRRQCVGFGWATRGSPSATF